MRNIYKYDAEGLLADNEHATERSSEPMVGFSSLNGGSTFNEGNQITYELVLSEASTETITVTVGPGSPWRSDFVEGDPKRHSAQQGKRSSSAL